MVTIIAGVLAFAVAVSRIVLLVHYPSDVICGYALGMAVAFIMYRLMRINIKDEESGGHRRNV